MIFNMEENKQPEKERICPCCKQTYKTKIGVGNWKNLFRKPTMEDWITLVILALLILASYAYVQETAQCKSMINNLDRICAQYDTLRLNLTKTETSVNSLAMPNFNFTTNRSNSSGNAIGGEKSTMSNNINASNR